MNSESKLISRHTLLGNHGFSLHEAVEPVLYNEYLTMLTILIRFSEKSIVQIPSFYSTSVYIPPGNPSEEALESGVTATVLSAILL